MMWERIWERGININTPDNLMTQANIDYLLTQSILEPRIMKNPPQSNEIANLSKWTHIKNLKFCFSCFMGKFRFYERCKHLCDSSYWIDLWIENSCFHISHLKFIIFMMSTELKTLNQFDDATKQFRILRIAIYWKLRESARMKTKNKFAYLIRLGQNNVLANDDIQ